LCITTAAESASWQAWPDATGWHHQHLLQLICLLVTTRGNWCCDCSNHTLCLFWMVSTACSVTLTVLPAGALAVGRCCFACFAQARPEEVRQGLALLSHELSRHSSRPNPSFTYHIATLAAYMKHRAWCVAAWDGHVLRLKSAPSADMHHGDTQIAGHCCPADSAS
jgi:hypothetical protein